jgi:hypothetical protein
MLHAAGNQSQLWFPIIQALSLLSNLGRTERIEGAIEEHPGLRTRPREARQDCLAAQHRSKQAPVACAARSW